MDHREFPDTSRRWMILDIIQTSQEEKWSLITKKMDTSTLFFWPQVNPRPQSWDTGTKIYRSPSRSLTTSNVRQLSKMLRISAMIHWRDIRYFSYKIPPWLLIRQLVSLKVKSLCQPDSISNQSAWPVISHRKMMKTCKSENCNRKYQGHSWHWYRQTPGNI